MDARVRVTRGFAIPQADVALCPREDAAAPFIAIKPVDPVRQRLADGQVARSDRNQTI